MIGFLGLTEKSEVYKLLSLSCLMGMRVRIKQCFCFPSILPLPVMTVFLFFLINFLNKSLLKYLAHFEKYRLFKMCKMFNLIQ